MAAVTSPLLASGGLTDSEGLEPGARSAVGGGSGERLGQEAEAVLGAFPLRAFGSNQTIQVLNPLCYCVQVTTLTLSCFV